MAGTQHTCVVIAGVLLAPVSGAQGSAMSTALPTAMRFAAANLTDLPGSVSRGAPV